MAATTIGRAASKAAIDAFSAMGQTLSDAGALDAGPDDRLDAAAELVVMIMKTAGVFDLDAAPQYDAIDLDIVQAADQALTDWGYCLG